MRKSLKRLITGILLLATALLMDIIFSSIIPNLLALIISLSLAIAGAIVGLRGLIEFFSEIL